MTREPEAIRSQTIVVFVLAVPWLWPLASGPWPAVLPWLVSLACAATLVLIVAWRRLDLGQPVALAWLAAAILGSLIGLVQYFGASAWLEPWVNVTPLGEAFANLRQRNQFATLTNLGLVVLLWGPLAHAVPVGQRLAGWHTKAAIGTYWPLAAAALLAAGNAASSSRTGLLQLLALVLLTWLWNGARDRGTLQVLSAALVGYGLAAIALPVLAGLDPLTNGIASRFGGGLPCGSRLTLWDNVLDLIAQKPVSGWGWGQLDYAHFITLYPGARFCEILDNAHNLPLHLAVELGVPLALLVCGLGAWLVLRARPWRETSPLRRMAWAALGLILLHSMLEYPLWYGPFQIAAGLCVWLLWSTGRAVPTDQAAGDGQHGAALSAPPSPAARAIAMSVAVLVLVCGAYAAWDYQRVSQIYLVTKTRTPAYREDTLEKIRGSWLFRNQVRFAELTLAELTRANAEAVNAMARDLLHFSPEPRVAEKVIESAAMLGRDDEVLATLARYRAAFPTEHARWANANPLLSGALAPAN